MPDVAAMSGQQLQVLHEMLQDPDKLAKLSADQILQISASAQAAQAQQNDQNERLRQEGLNDEQIANVNSAGFDVVPNTGEEPEGQAVDFDALSDPAINGLQAKALVDGAAKSVRGVFDLAKDIEVGLSNFFGANPLDTEKNRRQWKEQTSRWREEQSIEQMQEFGQLAPSGWKLAGEIAPWLFALPASAENFTGLLVKRSLQGGAMGASFVQGVDKSLIDRAWGATFGSGFGVASVIPSIVSGARKNIAQSFTRNFNNASAQQADAIQENVRRMTGDETFQFSIAQATGGRKAAAVELRAASEETKVAQNNNLNILSKHFFNRSRELAEGGASPGQIAIQMRNTLKEIHENVSSTASNQWKASHNALLEEFGDDIVIRGDEYLGKIDKMLAEAENILTNPGGKGVRGLTRYRQEVDVLVNPIAPQRNPEGLWQLYDRKAGVWLPEKAPDRAAVQAVADAQNDAFGGLDAESTLDIMKGLNSLIGGRSTISAKSTAGSNREVGRALMGNFTDALESTAQNPEAVQGINAMRLAYKEQMAYLQAVDDTVVSRIFGGKKLPENPGKKLDLVLKQEPEDLAATAQLLERHNPALLRELQASHLERIHGGSLTGKNPMVDTEVALDKFLTRLEGSMQGTGQAGRGLHTPAVQQEILTTAKALRTLKNRFFTGVAPDGGVGIDDIAINVVSRSPEFMARFVTRVVTTGKSLEAGMLDQSFRQAMKTIAEAPLGSEPMKMAMVYLTMWTNTAQVEAQEAERQAGRERNQKILEEQSNAFKRGD